ncbi:MAG: hypothetical protein ACKVHE_25090 [Planctomycetales bacterium]
MKIQLNEVEGRGFAVKPERRSRNQNPSYGGVAGLTMGMMMGNGYPVTIRDDYGGGESAESADRRRKAERTLRDVTAKLKQAKSDDDGQAAEKLLRSALDGYFAADLAVREREIKEIPERVSNLDKLNERRRQARDQVISLQLEVLTNEADGLGFFSTSSRRSSNLLKPNPVNIPGLNYSSFIDIAR